MKAKLALSVLGAAVVGLGVALWRARSEAAAAGARATLLARKHAELNYEFNQAQAKARETEETATSLDSQLGRAKTRAIASETKAVELTRALSERDRREADLRSETESLRRQLAAAPASIEAGALRARLAEREQQLVALLARALEEPASIGDQPPAADFKPPGVLRVGPLDSFVIMDYGADHGARAGQILGIRRGTTAVARVQISDARSRFSIAQVLPGSLKGQLQPGDLVVSTP